MKGKVPFRDVDHYSESLAPVWDLEFRQLTASQGPGGCSFVTDGRALIYQERYPAAVSINGAVGSERIAFALTDTQGQSGRWEGRGHPPDSIAYADYRKSLDVMMPAGTNNLVAVLPVREFADKFARLSGRDYDSALSPDRLFARMKDGGRERIATCLQRLMSEPVDAGTVTTSIVASLLDGCFFGTDEQMDDRRQSRQLFRRAVEICMEASPPLTSPGEIALRLDVSLRSLQLAFRACAGVSPGTYLRRLRLNRAHAMLLRSRIGETTVGAVGLDLGFTELGRFAGEYRELFAELPSETLAKPPRVVRGRFPDFP
ncbi:transcriptional regulator protein, araC family [Haloferula helveola]|uniref:Transcriptional regulator protein, araC family n=2 Tax=Haloferula helveola TaxID=490095 RepID=A0ABM7RI79_9BACT|nr:transcriptional regulator protein, araC family [Haloferula helveola]